MADLEGDTQPHGRRSPAGLLRYFPTMVAEPPPLALPADTFHDLGFQYRSTSSGRALVAVRGLKMSQANRALDQHGSVASGKGRRYSGLCGSSRNSTRFPAFNSTLSRTVKYLSASDWKFSKV